MDLYRLTCRSVETVAFFFEIGAERGATFDWQDSEPHSRDGCSRFAAAITDCGNSTSWAFAQATF